MPGIEFGERLATTSGLRMGNSQQVFLVSFASARNLQPALRYIASCSIIAHVMEQRQATATA